MKSNLSLFDPYATTTNNQEEVNGPTQNGKLDVDMICCRIHEQENEDGDDDQEGLELLKQIFPDLAIDELRKLHSERLRSNAEETNNGNVTIEKTHSKSLYKEPRKSQIATPLKPNKLPSTLYSVTPSTDTPSTDTPSTTTTTTPSFASNLQQESCYVTIQSPLGQRITSNLKQKSSTQIFQQPEKQQQRVIKVSLDPGFLRIPTSTAVPVTNPVTGRLEWKRLDHLEKQVQNDYLQFSASKVSYVDFTVALTREHPFGLGFTIREQQGIIYVLSLVEKQHQPIAFHVNVPTESIGPAQRAGILPGDCVLGVNGVSFLSMYNMETLRHYDELNRSRIILKQAGEAIVKTPDPVVLHFRRFNKGGETPMNHCGPIQRMSPLHFASLLSPPSAKSTTLKQPPRSARRTPEDIVSEHMAPSLEANDPFDDHELVDMSPHRHDLPSNNQSRSAPTSVSIDLLDVNQRPTHEIAKETKNYTDQTDTKATRKRHPFALLLRQKGLLVGRGYDEERQITSLIHRFTVRARQWETKSCFRLNLAGNVRDIYDPRNLPSWAASQHFATSIDGAALFKPYTPSTPPIRVKKDIDYQCDGADDDECEAPYFGANESAKSSDSSMAKSTRPLVQDCAVLKYPASKSVKRNRDIISTNEENGHYIPLTGCRKALCIRIVNYFLDGDRVAYTIWVYDAESEREWYAPVRYYRDFKDLHQSMIRIAPSISKCYSFPTTSWWKGASEAKETDSQKEYKCQQLEGFLRLLSGWIYTTSDLNEHVAEVAIHLQSFLGCDSNNAEDGDLDHGVISKGDSTQIGSSNSDAERIKHVTRIMLRRAIQRYTFRLFLLPSLQKMVNQFVCSTRAKQASSVLTSEDATINAVDSEQMKERVLRDLDHLKKYLDEMQNIIMEGCREDLIQICSHRDYSVLKLTLDEHDNVRDTIINEGLRQQLEIGMSIILVY